MTALDRRPIGEILVADAGLDRDVVDQGLARQAERGGRLGEVLAGAGLVDAGAVHRALARQLGVPFLDHLAAGDLEVAVRDTLGLGFLKRCGVVPFYHHRRPTVALHDPAMLGAADDLARRLGWQEYDLVVATPAAIVEAVHALYDTEEHTAAAERVIQGMEEDPESLFSAIADDTDLLDDGADAPVIRLVNLIFSQAVRDRASDIHIEPYRRRLKVRQRIDGILQDMLEPPVHVHAGLVSRLKVMAGLDIAEKRLPQDGRLEIRIGAVDVDVRVSTLPTGFGERVVLRLLYKSAVLKKLTDLGMAEDTLDRFQREIHAPHGIVLITGPTGSGKTTTLYAALTTLNQPDRNIITIEDPVEYRLEGVSQMQVNPAIGLTFASGLRTIVRQDPDVILVGEIRDGETAEIAVQAALTGHLVFSTLHTNDAVSAVTRLVKMGVEPFLIGAAVNAVLAQRLVRLLCPHCRAPYTPDDEVCRLLGMAAAGSGRFHRAVGCDRCRNSGYRGRSGIFEFFVCDDTVRSMLLAGADAAALERYGRDHGMRTLLEDGCRRIASGETSAEEVLRVTRL